MSIQPRDTLLPGAVAIALVFALLWVSRHGSHATDAEHTLRLAAEHRADSLTHALAVVEGEVKTLRNTARFDSAQALRADRRRATAEARVGSLSAHVTITSPSTVRVDSGPPVRLPEAVVSELEALRSFRGASDSSHTADSTLIVAMRAQMQAMDKALALATQTLAVKDTVITLTKAEVRKPWYARVAAFTLAGGAVGSGAAIGAVLGGPLGAGIGGIAGYVLGKVVP